MDDYKEIAWQWLDDRTGKPGIFTKTHLRIDNYAPKTLCGIKVPDDAFEYGDGLSGFSGYGTCRKCSRLDR